MSKFNWQNQHLPEVEDFNDEQAFQADGVARRLMDTHSWGIVKASAYPTGASAIPVSALNATPNQNPAIGEFDIVFDTDLGRLNIGAGSNPATPYTGGVAYDKNGNRIYIDTDKTFSFSTDIPEGKASSGNIGMPLSTTGTSGGCDTNVSVPGTYYLWAEFLETNDPTYPKVTRLGVTTYPHIQDGYKFVLTTTETAPNGDGVSIFLAKIVWAGAWPGVLTLSGDTEVSDGLGNSISSVPTASATEPHRVYFLKRQQSVEILPTEADRPATYAYGKRMNLRDHVSAVGGTSPTPNNPHGTTLKDIPGGTTEPKATMNQRQSLAKGIVDPTIPQNSPASQSTVLAMAIESSNLTPSGVSASQTTGTGIAQDNTAQEAWVRFKNTGTYGSAYVDGIRYTTLYPRLELTSDHAADSSPTDGWVGFSATDVQGTYAVYGSPGVIDGADVLFLRKVLVDGTANAISADIPDIDLTDGGLYTAGYDLLGPRLLLGYCYWNGTNQLYSDYIQDNQSAPVDKRSLGLVGPQQVSTEAKAESERGTLGVHNPGNLLLNSNFLLGKTGATTFPGWVGSLGAYTTDANVIQTTYLSTPSLSTEGPKTVTGLKVTPSAVAGPNTAHLYGTLAALKPNTYYCLSVWYKTGKTAWNSRVRLDISNKSASVLSGGSQDVLIVNDGNWHRASVVVKTSDSVLVVPALTTLYYYLDVLLSSGSAVAADDITFTDFQVTEGEWLTAYERGNAYQTIGPVSFTQTFIATGTQTSYPIANNFLSDGGVCLVDAKLTGDVNILTVNNTSIDSQIGLAASLTVDGVVVDTQTMSIKTYIQNTTGVSTQYPVCIHLRSSVFLTPGTHEVDVTLFSNATMNEGGMDSTIIVAGRETKVDLNFLR